MALSKPSSRDYCMKLRHRVGKQSIVDAASSKYAAGGFVHADRTCRAGAGEHVAGGAGGGALTFLYPSSKSSMPQATMPVVHAMGIVSLVVPTSPPCATLISTSPVVSCVSDTHCASACWQSVGSCERVHMPRKRSLRFSTPPVSSL